METNDSLWSTTVEMPAFAPLSEDLEVDVAIVGGGITGLTAAMLLAEAGKKVLVLEARTIGSGVSNRSTVHMTEMVDSWYSDIESDFGKDGARLVAESSRAAIEQVKATASRFGIDCGLTRKSGYLYTEADKDVSDIEKEHEAAKRAGLAVTLAERAPLPFATKRALVYPDQQQVHIARYLAGLARAATEKGARICEWSHVISVEDGEPCVLHLEKGAVVRARQVFCATHTTMNRAFIQTKIAAYRSYVVAYPNVSVPDGLYWDTADPYHYLSPFEIDGTTYLLVGGEDHKTGTKRETTECIDALHRWTKERMPVGDPSHRWSAQVWEPVDGLPFIGRNSVSQHVFVATGFSGNGTTYGPIAAMIVADVILGRPNAWAELYAATRVKPVSSALTYVEENVDFPMHFVSDRLVPPDAKQLGEIGPGEGKTIRVGGERLAVYRDPSGNVHACSAVCTHLGCLVKFNTAERTWDCPCHGSRFSIDGTVLDGPATRALARRSLEPERHQSGLVASPPSEEETKRSAGSR
jgi:glycine/D-amino acid oxidase-like deaminating enzyme/nitrite reductase/ring-hydroxylating ferredoxin subunit